MQLLYLTESQLRNQLFMLDFVRRFPKNKKVLLLHDAFGESAKDTRFVSKRLASVLSENMIHCMAFNAGQRGIVSEKNGQLTPKTDLIMHLLEQAPVLILGPVLAEDKIADPIQMLRSIRSALDIQDLIFFPKNPRSALISKRNLIEKTSDAQALQSIYEEENDCIQRALDFAPAWICGLNNWFEEV